jgi:hypothetical protein
MLPAREVEDILCIYKDSIRVLVGFGVSLPIVHIPAQCAEERINKFTTQLGFVVLWTQILVFVVIEPLDQFLDFSGSRQAYLEDVSSVGTWGVAAVRVVAGIVKAGWGREDGASGRAVPNLVPRLRGTRRFSLALGYPAASGKVVSR